MRAFSSILAGLFALGFAGLAQAAETCGAKTHVRFDETRAYFKEVLAGCNADLRCYVVSHVHDKSQPAGYRQQLRILKDGRDALYSLRFVTVAPTAVDGSKPFLLTVGSKVTDITSVFGLAPNMGNEYVISDQALTDDLVQQMRASNRAIWAFTSLEDGKEVKAAFSLRGSTAALDWIKCMAEKDWPNH